MHTPPTDVGTDGARVPAQRERGNPRGAAIIAVAWGLGLGAVMASRFRGDWGFYKGLHRWCAERGIPDFIRNLDTLLLFVGVAFLGAWLAARWSSGSMAGLLGLRRGRTGWGLMVLLALLPMVGGGLVLGWMRWKPGTSFDGAVSPFIGAVVRAPIAEELLFRGLLVGVCAAAIGWRGRRFWGNALAAALLFAVTHVTWDAPSLASGWPTLLVTGAGGLWYAWLLSRWGNLWVPLVLHAGMNLGWMLAAASGGAGGGGLVENLLRAATITIATWRTISLTRVQPSAM